MIELDKFLKGDENKLKEHAFFMNYKYEYMEKDFPTIEQAHDLLNKPLKVHSSGHMHHAEHKKIAHKEWEYLRQHVIKFPLQTIDSELYLNQIYRHIYILLYQNIVM